MPRFYLLLFCTFYIPTTWASCIPFEKIQFSGISVFKPQAIQTLLHDFSNSCLDKLQLFRMLQTIEKHYLEQGYVLARGFYRPSSTPSYILDLHILEGKLSRIDSGAPYLVRAAFHAIIDANKAFNIHDLTRGLQLLNRNPNAQARVTLIPGDTMGSAVAQLSMDSSQYWHSRLSIDNHSIDGLGHHRLALHTDVHQLVGIADHLSFGASSMRDHNAGYLHLSLPYHGLLYQLDASIQESLQFVQRYYPLVNQSVHYGLGIEHEHYRSESFGLLSAFGMYHNRSKRLLMGFGLSPYRTTVFEAALKPWMLYQDWRLNISWKLAAGSVWLHATHDVQLSKHDPHAQFFKPMVDLQASRKTQSWLFDIKWSYQYTHVGLHSSEQLGLAGSNGVMGVKHAIPSVDKGWVFKTEGTCLHQHPMPIAPMIDASVAHGVNLGMNKKWMIAAVGAGLKAAWSRFDARLAYHVLLLSPHAGRKYLDIEFGVGF